MDADPFQAEPSIMRGPRGRLAFRAHAGDGAKTGLLWCGGFRSDMLGGKATALHGWAARGNRPYVRFDYSGHGESDGRFEDGTIGAWLDDALAVLDGPGADCGVLVGSSMGAWVALLAALARPGLVKGLLLIAPAPDFTEDLMWAGFSETIRAQIMEEGVWMQPSPYGPTPITRALIEDGRTRLLLKGAIAFDGPVRILQGMEDDAVPYAHAVKLLGALTGSDVRLTLLKDGDHRLSREEDLALLTMTAAELCEGLDASRPRRK